MLRSSWRMVRGSSSQSSTWRELKAMWMVLESLIPKLKNERIRWFSDNQNVVRIMEIGSQIPELQEEAFAIFSIAAQNLIRIEPQWIPRSKNQQADYLSRLRDTDDWMIWPAIGQLPLTDLPTSSIHNYLASTQDGGALILKQLMHLPVTGVAISTGLAPTLPSP